MAHSKTDHALIAIKAALNLVPWLGGSLASLVGDYVPLSTQRSIERMALHLASQLRNLETRVDVEAVDKDEFADLFKSCYLTVIRTSNEEKLRAAAAILANLLLKPGDPARLSYTELDHAVRCIDQVSSGAIKVLGLAYQLFKQMRAFPVHDVRAAMQALGTVQGVRINFDQLQQGADGMDASLLLGLISELNAVNLLHMPGVPNVRAPGYANYPIELTPLGMRFVERLLVSEAQSC